MIKNRKVKTLLSILSLTLGGGLIYASTNEYISVGADSISNRSDDSMVLIASFVLGIALIAVGVMTAFFVFASKSDDY
ncbi:MAG: hypothetical protein BWY19_00606 [bacterium ADurb.Bin212]|nr:MAG: hypothetical protein BWY19_00606 [bacterium ADurb.Bin212]